MMRRGLVGSWLSVCLVFVIRMPLFTSFSVYVFSSHLSDCWLVYPDDIMMYVL